MRLEPRSVAARREKLRVSKSKAYPKLSYPKPKSAKVRSTLRVKVKTYFSTPFMGLQDDREFWA